MSEGARLTEQSRRVRVAEWLAVCIALAIAFATRPARAAGGERQGQCGPAAASWAARCAAREHVHVAPRFCVGDRVVLRFSAPGVDPLDIEVGRTKSGPPRVSVVGNFPDWEHVPRARRAFLGKARACVARGFDAAAFKPEQLVAMTNRKNESLPSPSLPWRLVVALLLAAGVWVVTARSVRRRRLLLQLVIASALTAAAFVWRRALFPPAFLHQNGQGPEWIMYALGMPSAYGPGYFQLFGLAARAQPAVAERAVFLEAGLLAATGPACVFAIARASRARPTLAWVLALLVLVAPGLARLADSESYFGVCTALLLLAGAVLAAGARAGRLRSWSFALAVPAAGLLISQAALVHPVCWLPAACVPLVVLAGRGGWRRRLRLTLVAGLGIAVVVAASTGAFLLAETHAQSRWNAEVTNALRDTVAPLGGWILALVVVAILARRRRPMLGRLALFVLLLLAVALPAALADKTLSPRLPLAIRFGSWSLALPAGAALVAASLALLGRLTPIRRREAAIAAGVAAIATVWFAVTWRAFKKLPTDVLEAEFVQSWRARLPKNSHLMYITHAKDNVVILPVYRLLDPRNLAVDALSAKGEDPAVLTKRYVPLLRRHRDVYYYHSSLCSTPPGAGPCAAIERHLELDPVAHTRLPVRPSAYWIHYSGSSVEVTLFRVRDVH